MSDEMQKCVLRIRGKRHEWIVHVRLHPDCITDLTDRGYEIGTDAVGIPAWAVDFGLAWLWLWWRR